MTTLETNNQHIISTLGRLEKNLADLSKEVSELRKDLSKEITELRKDMTKGFIEMSKDINNRLWRNFYFMIGGFAGVLAMIAHMLKWF